MTSVEILHAVFTLLILAISVYAVTCMAKAAHIKNGYDLAYWSVILIVMNMGVNFG